MEQAAIPNACKALNVATAALAVALEQYRVEWQRLFRAFEQQAAEAYKPVLEAQRKQNEAAVSLNQLREEKACGTTS